MDPGVTTTIAEPGRREMVVTRKDIHQVN